MKERTLVGKTVVVSKRDRITNSFVTHTVRINSLNNAGEYIGRVEETGQMIVADKATYDKLFLSKESRTIIKDRKWKGANPDKTRII